MLLQQYADAEEKRDGVPTAGFAVFAALARLADGLGTLNTLWGLVLALHLYRPREDDGSMRGALDAYAQRLLAARSDERWWTCWRSRPSCTRARTTPRCSRRRAFAGGARLSALGDLSGRAPVRPAHDRGIA